MFEITKEGRVIAAFSDVETRDWCLEALTKIYGAKAYQARNPPKHKSQK